MKVVFKTFVVVQEGLKYQEHLHLQNKIVYCITDLICPSLQMIPYFQLEHY